MRKSIVLLLVLAVGLALAVAPASADPPERFDIDDFWVINLAEYDGDLYWAFSNIEKETLCTWMEWPTPPPGINLASGKAVEASDAVVIQIKLAEAPTFVHRAIGDPGDPFFNPCVNSEDDPALVGALKIQANDNDGPNEGKRAAAFGDKGQGKVYDVVTDDPWHLSYVFRLVAPPDDNGQVFDPNWIKAENVNLHPIGKKK